LTFDAARLQNLNDELLASRLRMFEEGNYQSMPVERGPQPGRFYL
jgi:5-methylthioadenosine/S-adenosylhomocysteine deaminase